MSLPDTVPNKVRIQEQLLSWHANNNRDYPWRKTDDPYAVLIAEKLLQQTKARDAVVSAYLTILEKYPTPKAMVGADEVELREIIQPLGLSYRAIEIIEMSAQIEQDYGGKVPDTMQELLRLRGIGQYAARAVLSFVHRQNVAVVDTNVARFLHRLCGIVSPMPANPARKKYLQNLAARLLPEGRSRQFNLAILDLCALVCKPRKPLCHECPLSSYCSFGSEQIAESNDK
jgi:A/G-specific adenine glycosylase